MKKSFNEMSKDEFEDYLKKSSKEIDDLYAEYVCVKDNNDHIFGGKVGDIGRFLISSFDKDFIDNRNKCWVKKT